MFQGETQFGANGFLVLGGLGCIENIKSSRDITSPKAATGTMMFLSKMRKWP